MKIIFADIDGPLKSVRSYFIDEDKDVAHGRLDPLAIEILVYLCKRFDAKVVFNSRWSNGNLYEELRTDGFPVDDIVHDDGMTRLKTHGMDRLQAINEWLMRHNMDLDGDDWVSFDDANIQHPNAVLVSSEVGISPDNYRNATVILGDEDPFVVLL